MTVSGHVEGPLLAVTLGEDAPGVVLKLGSGFFSGGVKSGPIRCMRIELSETYCTQVSPPVFMVMVIRAAWDCEIKPTAAWDWALILSPLRKQTGSPGNSMAGGAELLGSGPGECRPGTCAASRPAAEAGVPGFAEAGDPAAGACASRGAS